MLASPPRLPADAAPRLKTIAHGLLERGDKGDNPSQVRATVIPNTEQGTIMGELMRNVEKETIVCTDSSTSYANTDTILIED